MKPIRRIVLDLETYYDGKYSLEKLPAIPAYVWDPLFKVHGIAIQYPDGACVFRPDVAQMLAELRSEHGDELERVVVVGHNMCFDYFVLFHVFNQKLRNIADTRPMSHLVNGPGQPASLRELAHLHRLQAKGNLEFMKGVRNPTVPQLAELASYAKNDVAITGALFDRYIPEVLQTPIELTIMCHTIRMFVERPFHIDRERVETGLLEIEALLGQELAAAGCTASDISGNKSFHRRFSEALARTGRQLPRKPGKRGTIPATARSDQEMLRLVNDENPEVRRLARLRLLVKSMPQKARRLEYLREAARHASTAHFEVVYHRAIHGRFAGSGGFNIQNVPVPERTGSDFDRQLARSLRKAICARTGRLLVAADACQVEARVGAWLAGQKGLSDAFANHVDIYSAFVSGVFGRPVRKPNAGDADHAEMQALRNVGKRAILGLGYGMGARTFISKLRETPEGLALFDRGILTNSICARIVKEYRERYGEIPTFWYRCEEAFRNSIEGFDSYLYGLHFFKSGGNVCIRLRSGRKVLYRRATLREPNGQPVAYINWDGVEDVFVPDRPEILYAARNDEDARLFGPKIVEHIVSGTARDVLVHAIVNLERQGWPVVGHCHDDIVCESPPDRADECLEAMISAWRSVPEWAAGLTLDAEGKSGRSLADIK